MPNTYTQLHIQLVFAVKYRAALIQKEWKERLHKYVTGILQANNPQSSPGKQHARSYSYPHWPEA